jgi:hypothetical protein
MFSVIIISTSGPYNRIRFGKSGDLISLWLTHQQTDLRYVWQCHTTNQLRKNNNWTNERTNELTK